MEEVGISRWSRWLLKEWREADNIIEAGQSPGMDPGPDWVKRTLWPRSVPIVTTLIPEHHPPTILMANSRTITNKNIPTTLMGIQPTTINKNKTTIIKSKTCIFKSSLNQSSNLYGPITISSKNPSLSISAKSKPSSIKINKILTMEINIMIVISNNKTNTTKNLLETSLWINYLAEIRINLQIIPIPRPCTINRLLTLIFTLITITKSLNTLTQTTPSLMVTNLSSMANNPDSPIEKKVSVEPKKPSIIVDIYLDTQLIHYSHFYW